LCRTTEMLQRILPFVYRGHGRPTPRNKSMLRSQFSTIPQSAMRNRLSSISLTFGLPDTSCYLLLFLALPVLAFQGQKHVVTRGGAQWQQRRGTIWGTTEPHCTRGRPSLEGLTTEAQRRAKGTTLQPKPPAGAPHAPDVQAQGERPDTDNIWDFNCT